MDGENEIEIRTTEIILNEEKLQNLSDFGQNLINVVPEKESEKYNLRPQLYSEISETGEFFLFVVKSLKQGEQINLFPLSYDYSEGEPRYIRFEKKTQEEEQKEGKTVNWLTFESLLKVLYPRPARGEIIDLEKERKTRREKNTLLRNIVAGREVIFKSH